MNLNSGLPAYIYQTKFAQTKSFVSRILSSPPHMCCVRKLHVNHKPHRKKARESATFFETIQAKVPSARAQARSKIYFPA